MLLCALPWLGWLARRALPCRPLFSNSNTTAFGGRRIRTAAAPPLLLQNRGWQGKAQQATKPSQGKAHRKRQQQQKTEVGGGGKRRSARGRTGWGWGAMRKRKKSPRKRERHQTNFSGTFRRQVFPGDSIGLQFSRWLGLWLQSLETMFRRTLPSLELPNQYVALSGKLHKAKLIGNRWMPAECKEAAWIVGILRLNFLLSSGAPSRWWRRYCDIRTGGLRN